MKLHIAQTSGRNVVTGYGEGFIAINGTRHETHLLVTAERVMPWQIGGFESVTAEVAGQFMAQEPELVVLGTGAVLRFPHSELARRLAAAGIGLEVMDSKAACRTYNVLMAEGRRVLAAILIE
ncbi:MAG: Mth938-like domain-containing protein [Betaproteobacteria bacterium]